MVAEELHNLLRLELQVVVIVLRRHIGTDTIGDKRTARAVVDLVVVELRLLAEDVVVVIVRTADGPGWRENRVGADHAVAGAKLIGT